ncbi:MAG: DUF4145 domain-containing protein [Candidatus Helarchaeota archaeon]|nr:DUF4145 domain-containing protein [Candidatus Helarchaeota archaeon]
MIIECPYCDSKVDAKVLAQHESFNEERDSWPIRVSLLECPVCKNGILAEQEVYIIGEDKYQLSLAERVWPEPEKYLDLSIPDLVRSSLEEAKKCYKAKANSACAVMCGKMLESICSEYKTKNKFLGGGLKELLDKKVIDKKIYLWGEELRKHRNIGAHVRGEKISREDARDLLDFASAICDYIFVLSNRFENFMKRKEKSKKK